mgnify:CR=1 FL=1
MLANNNVNDDNRPSQIINMFWRNFSPASHVLDFAWVAYPSPVAHASATCNLTGSVRAQEQVS